VVRTKVLQLASLVAVVSWTTAAQAAAENSTVKIGSTQSDLPLESPFEQEARIAKGPKASDNRAATDDCRDAR
jgi:hypothetical protein